MPESSGSFAGLLRELRLAARLTQEELADAAGLSLRAVSDLERGVVATPQRLSTTARTRFFVLSAATF